MRFWSGQLLTMQSFCTHLFICSRNVWSRRRQRRQLFFRSSSILSFECATVFFLIFALHWTFACARCSVKVLHYKFNLLARVVCLHWRINYTWLQPATTTTLTNLFSASGLFQAHYSFLSTYGALYLPLTTLCHGNYIIYYKQVREIICLPYQSDDSDYILL